MKFSLFSLIVLTALAGLTFAAVNVSGLFYIFLRFAVLLSVLAAIIAAIYGKDDARPFAFGWALCAGTIIGLHFFRFNLIGIYLPFQFSDPGQAGVVDVDLSVIAGYFGGCYAQLLHRRNAAASPQSGA